MAHNEQSQKLRKEISTLLWDLPNIRDMDLKLSKEKRLSGLREELRSIADMEGV